MNNIEQYNLENMREHNFQWTDKLVGELIDEVYWDLKNGVAATVINEGYVAEFKDFYKQKQDLPWEIIIVSHINNSLYTANADGNFVGPLGFTIGLRKVLKRKDLYSILSVKRKSDGEVFNIGDYDERWGKIIRFEWPDLRYAIQAVCDDGKPEPITVLFYEWKKKQQKKSVFTTSKGETIYDGDSICLVLGDWDIQKRLADVEIGNMHEGCGVKIFKTKEEAESYVSWNKPCLRLKDILMHIDSFRISPETQDSFISRLLSFIKEKLL